ncbi:two component transcriptional regulator, winged helix family [Methylorubrum populi BJ001]|jgi:DNA-binding response OmpR family regulator|uniref:Two component transcriptional regulator, winged helix family n=2 Tax=Methylorubrum populi TaxID=223967 RepID=B1ZLF1_METPB|nr:two component transcriptional regulator, winged helix family [Methylorubrum populi BJ001]
MVRAKAVEAGRACLFDSREDRGDDTILFSYFFCCFFSGQGRDSPMTATGPHIAVVDDEADARAMVGDYLRLHGFDVALCEGGRALRAHLQIRTPDLIVLDLNMPEEDGLSIVRDMKARSPIPIIMLTATASPIDRVVGLELGADDYLPKPCELRELVARVRSVLRRAQGAPPPPPAQPTPAPEPAACARTIRFGTKWLELDALRLRDDAGVEQPLTRSEFDLLKAFADHPKRALSRERLLDLADARDPDAFDRAIDVRINRIRKKVEPDPANPRFIRTVRGLGYIFRPDGD